MSDKQVKLAGLLADAINRKYIVKYISGKTGLSERRIKHLKVAYKIKGIESSCN